MISYKILSERYVKKKIENEKLIRENIEKEKENRELRRENEILLKMCIDKYSKEIRKVGKIKKGYEEI